MKPNAAKGVIAGFLVLSVFLGITVSATGELRYHVESANLTIYRDGLVHIKQTLTVNETFPEITLPLLSTSFENLIVLDENQTVLDYVTNGLNLTVFTLGAKGVLLEYDTTSLTMKQAEVWTLVANSPYPLTVFLPENSTIVYINQMPTAIDSKNNKITLSLFPGYWEISYIIPLLPPEESADDYGPSKTIPIEYLIAAAVAVAAVFLFILLLVRRRRGPNAEKIIKANPQLKKEEKDVIRFLAEMGGRAFEAEIRKHFPDMPRTSLWRLVRRLERLELVEVKKIGLENRVELKK